MVAVPLLLAVWVITDETGSVRVAEAMVTPAVSAVVRAAAGSGAAVAGSGRMTKSTTTEPLRRAKERQ